MHIILPNAHIIPCTPEDKTSILSGGCEACGPTWSSLRGSANIANHDNS